ncbi:hypothetical protein GW17_00031570 [Ensete ventricosum]|nr:hypothetical protein GW17_00031570 [Ensete ventricosum]RZS19999.1 hypothetical protein BHM03_00052469 [Ensete ventricosum]
MKSGSGEGNGSAVPSTTSASATVDIVGSMAKKRPKVDKGESLKKRNKKAAPEQPTNASGSTTRAPLTRGKGWWRSRRPPSRDIPFRTCVSVIIDRVHDAGRLVQNQHERILALWDANKELKLGANQELVAAAEHRAKELEEDARKLRAELESLKNQQKGLKQEVGVLRSSLDGARNDRARIKGDVSSLTEVVTLLEAKLKAEGPKALAAYKAS